MLSFSKERGIQLNYNENNPICPFCEKEHHIEYYYEPDEAIIDSGEWQVLCGQCNKFYVVFTKINGICRYYYATMKLFRYDFCPVNYYFISDNKVIGPFDTYREARLNQDKVNHDK